MTYAKQSYLLISWINPLLSDIFETDSGHRRPAERRALRVSDIGGFATTGGHQLDPVRVQYSIQQPYP